ncbi:MAG: hypothetical protein AAF413_04270 [Patescibacteria group bacterium]
MQVSRKFPWLRDCQIPSPPIYDLYPVSGESIGATIAQFDRWNTKYLGLLELLRQAYLLQGDTPALPRGCRVTGLTFGSGRDTKGRGYFLTAHGTHWQRASEATRTSLGHSLTELLDFSSGVLLDLRLDLRRMNRPISETELELYRGAKKTEFIKSRRGTLSENGRHALCARKILSTVEPSERHLLTLG